MHRHSRLEVSGLLRQMRVPSMYNETRNVRVQVLDRNVQRDKLTLFCLSLGRRALAARVRRNMMTVCSSVVVRLARRYEHLTATTA